MEEFVKELEQLPIERQKAIKEGLQKQILAQAVFVRDEQPTKFLAYIDDEIGKADASMFKMVQESSREGAVSGSISEIYIWNKERKKVLIGLKQEYLDITQADIEKQQPEPQQEQIKPTRRKGRPTEPFASKMINDADGKKLKKIHTISQGKMGKDFALIIWACIEKGWCNKPTYTQVRKEFGNIGSSTGYNRYLSNGSRMFTQQEKDGVLKSLD